jgi:hypothetical protein
MGNSSGVVAETLRFSESNVVPYSTVFAFWINGIRQSLFASEERKKSFFL